jgi:hypothetical protein
MNETKKFAINAFRILEDDTRECDAWAVKDEGHARGLGRLLSRVDEYSWIEVRHGATIVAIYVKGHCVVQA